MQNFYNKIKDFKISYFIVFHAINNNNTATKLHKNLFISPTSVTYNLKMLVKLNLITKEKDKRITKISYTSLGLIFFPIVNALIVNINKLEKV